MAEKIEELSQKFEEDLNLLIENINRDEQTISIYLSHIAHDDILYMDLDIFVQLINKYCFRVKNVDYLKRYNYIPNDRLLLFKKLFLNKMTFDGTKTIRWINGFSGYSEEILYHLLFLHIFKEKLTTEYEVFEIVKKAIKEWREAFKDNQLPVTVEIILPRVFLTGKKKVRLNTSIEIQTYGLYHWIRTKSSGSTALGRMGIILSLNTKLDFNHNFFGDYIKEEPHFNDPYYKNQLNDKLKNMQEIIFSMFLLGIDFIYDEFELKVPWWIEQEFKSYNLPECYFKKYNLDDTIISRLSVLYKKINTHNLFLDKELEIPLYRYFKLNQRELLDDSILDDFIILESIFTRGGKTEVGFRLALNLALFISKDFKEFNKIFEIMNKLYSIRSSIAHGGEWYNLVRKKNIPQLLGLSSSSIRDNKIVATIHRKLKSFIDRAFIKIFDLKIKKFEDCQSYNLLDQLKGVYFLLNSEIFEFKKKPNDL